MERNFPVLFRFSGKEGALKGRFPFDQIFRFEIPGIPCDEWNSIFWFQVWLENGRVEKTDPRSADYPLTPTPRTTLWATPRTTLRTTPTDYPKKSTKFLLQGRKIQEAYLFFLHDHNCTKNSHYFLFRNFSTQSISFSSHSSPASYQNAVSTMHDR